MNKSQAHDIKLIKVSWWHVLKECGAICIKLWNTWHSSIYFRDAFTCSKCINTCTGWVMVEQEGNGRRRGTQKFFSQTCDVLFFKASSKYWRIFCFLLHHLCPTYSIKISRVFIIYIGKEQIRFSETYQNNLINGVGFYISDDLKLL